MSNWPPLLKSESWFCIALSEQFGLATQERTLVCSAAMEWEPQTSLPTAGRSSGQGEAAHATTAHSEGDKCLTDKTPDIGTAPHYSTEVFYTVLFVSFLAPLWPKQMLVKMPAFMLFLVRERIEGAHTSLIIFIMGLEGESQSIWQLLLVSDSSLRLWISLPNSANRLWTTQLPAPPSTQTSRGRKMLCKAPNVDKLNNNPS